MLPDMDKKPEKQLIIKMAGYLEKKGRMRTKSKSEQDEWFVALRDARNNNQTFIRPGDRKSSVIMEMHCSRLSNRISVEYKTNNSVVNENHLRYGRSPPTVESPFDEIFSERSKKNGSRIVADRRSSALRKSESDNRISFYREMHGLIRTETITAVGPAVISDKESCRSRSLSYESIYFKPQENNCATNEPVKSQSCRELVPCKIAKRTSQKCVENIMVSKRMSRSVSFFQRRCGEDSDSDDYDYIEEKYSNPMANIQESDLQYPPELPDRRGQNDEDIEPRSEDFPNQETNVEIIYVNNNRKVKMFTNESESDLMLEYGTERMVEVEDEPPPLPIKQKCKQDNISFENNRQYKITDGVYVFENDGKEIIYDVPIPHGKLIEHFRRLTVTPAAVSPVKRACTDIYDDSLEPSLYETLHMTPDSLEIATMFPTYKRWSNDSGFNNYEEPNSFSPEQTHFEDSLEPVIAMMHHDRKIWQNVPNINSTDYFR